MRHFMLISSCALWPSAGCLLSSTSHSERSAVIGPTTSAAAPGAPSATPGNGTGGLGDVGASGGSSAGSGGPQISVALALSPSSKHLAPGGTAIFSATVSGSSDTRVLWSVGEGADAGSIDTTGIYTAPAIAGTYHVIAQSHADTSITQSATVVVAPPGACDALPAPGTWDAASISPVATSDGQPAYDQTGKSMAVVVDPFNPSTVWLGTGYQGLRKSTDCGSTWTRVTTASEDVDASAVWSLIVDPVNEGVIYAAVTYGPQGLWKSTNSGADWAQLFPADSAFSKLIPYNSINNVSFDATDPSGMHLLVASHGSCNDPYPLGCLAESFDGGATWPNIVSMPASWGEKGGAQIVNATTWIWGTGDSINGMYVTTDNGTSWNHTLKAREGDGMGELSILPLTRAADQAYYISSGEGVLRSTDGVAWSPIWNQGPTTMGIAVTAKTIYASDNTSLYAAPLDDYTNWKALPTPAAWTSNDYAQFIASDEAHHVLYIATWWGLYRYVTE